MISITCFFIQRRMSTEIEGFGRVEWFAIAVGSFLGTARRGAFPCQSADSLMMVLRSGLVDPLYTLYRMIQNPKKKNAERILEVEIIIFSVIYIGFFCLFVFFPPLDDSRVVLVLTVDTTSRCS